MNAAAAVDFITSVAALASAGLSLSKSLYQYASNVSSASKKLNDLAQDVNLTSSVLEHLSEVFAEATSRAFVRPGALHTAQEAIAGCSEIFEEMEALIEEGRKGLGKFILPFKETKIQLLNARLASLKSTLQLLLQVLQYASTVSGDPGGSQFSLGGTWVMSQFKLLIDEREEAQRRYEQLKAEAALASSGAADQHKGCAIIQRNLATSDKADDFEIQPVPQPITRSLGNESELATYSNKNSTNNVPATLSSIVCAENSQVASSTLLPVAGLNTMNDNNPQSSNFIETTLIFLTSGVDKIFCWPCKRSHGCATADVRGDDDDDSDFLNIGSSSFPPIESQPIVARLNLQKYGPEAVFEMASPDNDYELPAPAKLGTYYL